jgi:hypothetical protein
MSLPPTPDAHDEVDDRYRRASAIDPSRPGEAVRRRVLEHAAQLAAERSGSRASVSGNEASVRRRLPRSWRPAALFGTLAAAAVAGLMIAPRVLMPPAAPSRAVAPPVEALREGKLSQRPAPALELAPFTHAEPAAKPPPADQASVASLSAQASERRDAYAREVAEAEQRAAKVPVADGAGVAADAGAAAKAPSENVAAQQQVVVTAARRALAPPTATVESAALAPPVSKASDSTAAFRHAAETGDLRSLDRLLAMQPDINARDAAGRTPLMLAIVHGQTDVVSALLAYGADPNAADSSGTTPLQAARAAGRPAIVAALQRYGAH